MTKDPLNNEPRLLVQNHSFFNRSSIAEYFTTPEVFGGLSFVNCRFENLDMTGIVFGSCRFQNCIFNELEGRKATIANCQFEGCKIENSDILKTEFSDTIFPDFQQFDFVVP